MDRDGRVAGSRNFGLGAAPQKQIAVAFVTAVHQHQIALSPFDVYLDKAVKRCGGSDASGYTRTRDSEGQDSRPASF